MANEILTAEAVCSAVDLYGALPATTSFRGFTGHGLVVDQKDNEIIAPIAQSKGIWKPMYFSINGGAERRGRKTVNALQIAAAVEQFEANSLLAALRSTSGRGLRLDDAGMVELVDAGQATAQINFEVTHYGGGSIVPLFNVKLGRLTIGDVEWQSGFSYNASGNKPMRVGEELVLTRFLAKSDVASDAILARVWQDVNREANRLTLLHTDGTLPKSYEDRGNRMSVMLSQELTTLVQGVRLEKEQDFDYRVRGDKVVEVQMFLGKDDVRDEASFAATLDAFRKECNRVYMLYCQPLNDRQKGLLGRPSSEVHGFATTPQIEWQPQRDNREKIIGFHPNAKNGNAVFPADGWNPKRGKTHRVYSCRKGRGFTGYPAPALYEERLEQKDQQTAVRQLIRVEFDGSEKVVVNGEEIKLAEKQQMQESNYWSDRLELMEDGNWWIVQTCTPHWQTLREVVTDDYNHHNVNGQYAKKIEWRCILNEPCPAERRFQPDRMWVEINGYQGGNPSTNDLARLDQAKALYGYKFKAHGMSPDGKEIEVGLKPQKNQYYVTWDEIPLNNQMGFLIQQNVDWPLCSCMMGRRKADHDFCNFCATHRNCQSCGKPTGFWGDAIAKAEASGSKLYCDNCKKHLESVAIVDAKISLAMREEIAADAQKFLAGVFMNDEEEVQQHIRQAVLRRYRIDYERSRVLQQLGQVTSLITTQEGEWASTYTKTELERFAMIHEQSGSELMVSIAMLVDQGFRESNRRRPGQNVAHAEQYAYAALQGGRMPELKLARFVAESEAFVQVIAQAVADVETALVDFRAKLAYLPDSDERVKKVSEAKSALENKDFAKAKELAAAAQQLIAEGMAMIASGEVMAYFTVATSARSRTYTDVFAIVQDGTTIPPMAESLRSSGYVYKDLPNSALVVSHSHDNYGYQYNEHWEVHCLPAQVSEAQKSTLRRMEQETRNYFTGPDTGWDVRQVGMVSFSTAYHRDFQGVEAQLDAEMRASENLPIDVTKWEQTIGDDGHVVVGPYRRQSKEAKAITEAEDAELNARGTAMTLEQEKQDAQAVYYEILAAWVERDSVKDGSRPVEEGTAFAVSRFIKETNRAANRDDFVSEPFFDWASGTQVKLVLDPYSQASAGINEQNRDVLVRVRARNSGQVHLAEAFIRPAEGGHKVRTLVYFVVPVPSPEDFDRQIAEADQAHRAAVEALERTRRAADLISAKKRAEQEAVRTVAEVPHTVHRDTSASLNPLAEAMRKAGLA